MPIPVILAAVILFLLLAVLIVCACLARYLVYPPRPSFRDTYRLEAAMRYLRDYDETESEYYTVPSFDGYELHVELLANPDPTDRYVILTHGNTDNHIGCLKYVPMYMELGYNCIVSTCVATVRISPRMPPTASWRARTLWNLSKIREVATPS